MKTIIRITPDYNASLSYDEWCDDISEIVNSIDVHFEIDNRNFINRPRQLQKDHYHHTELLKQTIVNVTGYSKSDWQTYTIYHNLEDDNEQLLQLIDLLQKQFTHQNDYIVEKFEQVEVNEKVYTSDPHDYTSFCIRDIEFPNDEQVLNRYIEHYGIDYDEAIVEIG